MSDLVGIAVPGTSSSSSTGITGSPAVTGQWYRGGYPSGAASTPTTAIGTMYARRFLLMSGTLVRIGAQHFSNATASELLRLGIYNDNNGLPGTLLLDAGTIDLSTATGFKQITISQAIATGYYWFANVRQGPTNAAVVVGYPAITQTAEGVHEWEQFDGTNIYSGTQHAAKVTGVAGALPTPYGAASLSADDGNDALVGWRY